MPIRFHDEPVNKKPVVHSKKLVVHTVVHKKRKAGVYADPDARKLYRREWMRRMRAEAKALPS
jgi:hypothetical protein